MKYEIGSFFESYKFECINNDGQSVDTWLQGNLEGNSVCYVESGREAIKTAILDMQTKQIIRRKTCMLPMYTCDTVIIPFLEDGWEIFYYSIDENFEIDKDSFCRQLEKCKPNVLLMHTYYGMDSIESVRDVIDHFRNQHKMIFVEDFTQNINLLEKKYPADYKIGSLRKWFPLSDGGFVSCKDPINVAINKENQDYVDLKMKAQDLKYQYLHDLDNIEKSIFLDMNKKSEEMLYLLDEVHTMSYFSQQIMKKIEKNEMLNKRDTNFKILHDAIHFDGIKVKRAMNTKVRQPLYYVLYAENRENLQKYLQNKNIYAPVLWPIPVEEAHLSKTVKYIFDKLLAIPCDYRYEEKDMSYIAKCINEYIEK